MEGIERTYGKGHSICHIVKENNETHLIPFQICYSKSAKTHGMQLMHKSHSTKLKARHPPCFTNSAERIGKHDERLTADDPDEGHLTSVSLALVGEFPLSGIFPGLRTQRATLGAIGFEGSQSLSPTAFPLSPDVSRSFETSLPKC